MIKDGGRQPMPDAAVIVAEPPRGAREVAHLPPAIRVPVIARAGHAMAKVARFLYALLTERP
jgi:hypothetical protein